MLKLDKFNVILGSESTRRKKLLTEMGIKFKIKTTQEKESYPENLAPLEIASFLAQQKANFISEELSGDYLLITADTTVIHNKQILHKPKDKDDAIKILRNLSGKTHKVISGVCIKTRNKHSLFSSVTKVSFYEFSDTEIHHYIKNFKPFDKAGSYGIQEFIGHIAIRKINGSYNNVVGLPTAKLYQKLKLFI